MFVDASAIVAILTREPEADSLADLLEAAPSPITSPIAVFEAALGICRKRHASVEEAEDDVREFLELARIQLIPITAKEADTALAVNAELNCHFFADADVPRLTNSLFLAPDTIAGCVGSYAVPPPDDFAESRAGAAVFSGAC